MVEKLRQPAHQQPLAVAGLHIDAPLLQGAHTIEVRHEGEHTGGGVGEHLFQIASMRHDAHVSGVL